MKQWWFVIALAVALIGLAIYAVLKPFSSTVTPEIISGVPSAEYTNQELHFSIWYPTTAAPSQVDFQGYLPLTQTSVVSFTLPKTMFAGTNLTEAGVYIGATTSPSVVAVCTKPLQNEGEKLFGTAKIGGADFSVFTSTGAGAGNIYDEKTYRRVQDGTCIEFTELLHSGNIANYDPGTVQQFDHSTFSGILENIVQTYQTITVK